MHLDTSAARIVYFALLSKCSVLEWNSRVCWGIGVVSNFPLFQLVRVQSQHVTQETESVCESLWPVGLTSERCYHAFGLLG